MSKHESSAGPTGALLCHGCGQVPEEGRVLRLADGSACNCCAERLLESLPSLLPSISSGRRNRSASRSRSGSAPARDESEFDVTASQAERFVYLQGGGNSESLHPDDYTPPPEPA